MEDQSSSMGTREEPNTISMCFCGLPASLKTSWSNDNPDRRFFGCSSYGSRFRHPCRFFRWFDTPISPRARLIILGFLKNVRDMERGWRDECMIWWRRRVYRGGGGGGGYSGRREGGGYRGSGGYGGDGRRDGAY